MHSLNPGFAKGMAAGLVVGAAAAILIDPVSDRQHKRMMKKANGIFRNIGGAIDTAMDFIHG